MDWLKTLGSIAPTLATALGGPLAGAATKFIANKFLGDENASSEQIADFVMNASPEQLNELKTIDNNFKLDMKKLGVDVYRIDHQDRNNARDREVKTGSWANAILAGIVVLGFFATVGYVLIKGLNVEPASAALIGTLIGYVSAKADQVISYYFGSSAGSKEKNQLLQQSENFNRLPK